MAWPGTSGSTGRYFCAMPTNQPSGLVKGYAVSGEYPNVSQSALDRVYLIRPGFDFFRRPATIRKSIECR